MARPITRPRKIRTSTPPLPKPANDEGRFAAAASEADAPNGGERPAEKGSGREHDGSSPRSSADHAAESVARPRPLALHLALQTVLRLSSRRASLKAGLLPWRPGCETSVRAQNWIVIRSRPSRSGRP